MAKMCIMNPAVRSIIRRRTCQDQRLKVRFNNKKIRVNKLGPSWPVSTERVWRELNLSLGKMADGSDREVTQADQNNINSQWSLFFTDLDELLSEYEQHRSMNDIARTENLTIRLENAVRALQSVSHFVSYTNKEAVLEMALNFQLMFWDCHRPWSIVGVNFQVEQDVHKLPFFY